MTILIFQVLQSLWDPCLDIDLGVKETYKGLSLITYASSGTRGGEQPSSTFPLRITCKYVGGGRDSNS